MFETFISPGLKTGPLAKPSSGLSLLFASFFVDLVLFGERDSLDIFSFLPSLLLRHHRGAGESSEHP